MQQHVQVIPVDTTSLPVVHMVPHPMFYCYPPPIPHFPPYVEPMTVQPTSHPQDSLQNSAEIDIGSFADVDNLVVTSPVVRTRKRSICWDKCDGAKGNM